MKYQACTGVPGCQHFTLCWGSNLHMYILLKQQSKESRHAWPHTEYDP